MKKVKKEEIIARLTIYNLPILSAKEYENLLVWLEGKFEEMQKANLNDYSKRFTATLFK